MKQVPQEANLFHLIENDGKSDEHLGLGMSSIPLRTVCGALEKQAPQAIWPTEAAGDGILQSLAWLENWWLL